MRSFGFITDVTILCASRGVREPDEQCGEDEEHDGREGDEENGVAEVGDAGGDSGAGRDGGRRRLDDERLSSAGSGRV